MRKVKIAKKNGMYLFILWIFLVPNELYIARVAIAAYSLHKFDKYCLKNNIELKHCLSLACIRVKNGK